MSTPRIDRILGELVAKGRELHEGTCPSLLVEEARSIESELEAAKARIAALEKAGDAVLNAWLMPEDAMPYDEWIALSADAKAKWYKAKESKP